MKTDLMSKTKGNRAETGIFGIPLPLDPLTQQEKSTYEDKLGRLKKIASYWFEMGKLLLEIRDQRLYREHYSDFASFCRAELGMGKSNCNRTLQCTQIVRRNGHNCGQTGAGVAYPPAAEVDRLR